MVEQQQDVGLQYAAKARPVVVGKRRILEAILHRKVILLLILLLLVMTLVVQHQFLESVTVAAIEAAYPLE